MKLQRKINGRIVHLSVTNESYPFILKRRSRILQAKVQELKNTTRDRHINSLVSNVIKVSIIRTCVLINVSVFKLIGTFLNEF